MEEALLNLTAGTSRAASDACCCVAEWNDPFRMLPIRFLGYGAALGEALRGETSTENVEIMSGTSSLFLVSHMAVTGLHAYTQSENVLETVLDTLLFDTVATVLIPIFISHRVRKLVRWYLEEHEYDEQYVNHAPAVVAMGTVLLASRGVDWGVETIISRVLSDIFNIQRPSNQPSIPCSPTFPVAPLLPFTPKCPQKKSPPCASKKEGDKDKFSVVISGDPGYKFDLRINGQKEKGKNGGPCSETSCYQKSGNCEKSAAAVPSAPPSIGRRGNQDYKLWSPGGSNNIPRKSFKGCRETSTEYQRAPSGATPMSPIIFKNLKINLSSKSPMRAIYRDPYGPEQEAGARSLGAGTRSQGPGVRPPSFAAGRSRPANARHCSNKRSAETTEAMETEGFDCVCTPASAVINVRESNNGGYESGRYCDMSPRRFEDNSAPKYSDKFYD